MVKSRFGWARCCALVVAFVGSNGFAPPAPTAASAPLDDEPSTWPYRETHLPRIEVEYPLAGIGPVTVSKWMSKYARVRATNVDWRVQGQRLVVVANERRHAEIRDLLDRGCASATAFESAAAQHLKIARLRGKIRELTFCAASEDNVIACLQSKLRYLALTQPTPADLNRLVEEQVSWDFLYLYDVRRLQAAETAFWAARSKDDNGAENLATSVEQLADRANAHAAEIERRIRRDYASLATLNRRKQMAEIRILVAHLRRGLADHNRSLSLLRAKLDDLTRLGGAAGVAKSRPATPLAARMSAA